MKRSCETSISQHRIGIAWARGREDRSPLAGEVSMPRSAHVLADTRGARSLGRVPSGVDAVRHD